MPLTENELRDLLHQRSAGAPATPDRVGAVRARVAKQRRRELAAVSGALALVVAAGALWVLPRTTATPVPPATSSPTPAPTADEFTTVSEVGGLLTAVTGPFSISGTTPFDLTLKVTNDGDSEWTGMVAAGVVSDAEVPGLYEGGLVAAVDPVDGYPGGLGVALPDAVKQFTGIMPAASVTLAPGESRTWTMSAQRSATVPVTGTVLGWLPSVQRDGDTSSATVPAGGRAITVTPAGSTLSCASVSIGSWHRGQVQPWTVDVAYTAVVGADGKATWEEIPGLGDQGTSVTTTQSGNVRSSTIMKALADQGAAEASGFGADLPDRPATLDPGRYVAYSGTQLVPIDFAGTCGPSGEAISGTWTAYNDRTTGLLDCAATEAATLTELGLKAKAYCPKP
ncbi:MAG: hypothetical protein AB7O74_05115 [Candidatus Nanopelagicales bacterium]